MKQRSEIHDDQAEIVTSTASILTGIHATLALVEDEVEQFDADETATALRQAQTYLGIAIDRWRTLK